MQRFIIFSQICAGLGILTLAMDQNIELLTNAGYPAEKHIVTTEDNYLLTVHRIPPKLPGAKIVFAMHGLFLSASDYLRIGPKHSLAFILHDAGFDVWLGNARGTTFSRQHKTFDPNVSSEYWDYSFNEIGKFDLPAMIDYALTATNQSALHYVGHSQGCTSFLVMLALRPEYNAKIVTMHAMAPAAFLSSTQVVKRGLVSAFTQLQSMAEKFERNDGIAIEIPAAPIGMCRNKKMLHICFNALFKAIGTKPPRMTEENIAYFMRNFPNSISSKQLVHFQQIIRSGNFQQFDYEPAKNMLVYNRKSPPHYNLNNVACDVQILYGGTDRIVDPSDVEKLMAACGERIVDVVFVEGANHFDFVYSASANMDFYSKIIAFIVKHKPVQP